MIGLRAAVWSAMHDATCDEKPPHPYTDHLPWDEPEAEADAIREADAIIRALIPEGAVLVTEETLADALLALRLTTGSQVDDYAAAVLRHLRETPQ